MENDAALIERIVTEPMLGRIFFENLGLEELSLEDVEQNPLMLTTSHYHFVLFNALKKAGEAAGQTIDIPAKFSKNNDEFVHPFRRFGSALKASALLFAEYERVTGLGNGDMPAAYVGIFRQQYRDMLAQSMELYRQLEREYSDPETIVQQVPGETELVDTDETLSLLSGIRSFLRNIVAG